MLLWINNLKEANIMLKRLQRILRKFIDKFRFYFKVIFKISSLKLSEFIPIKTFPYNLGIS